LTGSCLWFDEIFGVHAAEHDWENLFRFVAQDLIHPPLFYVLLKIWILVGGESLFWLRFFPVFFSTIALIPLYFLCRALKLNYAAIALAFAFFAFNGALIKYSQEVRMYAPLVCLSLFSLWLFVRFLNLGKSFWILTIVNILLVYMHYFGWLVVVSEVVAILILQRIKIRQILIMFGINLIAFVPWIFMVWRAAETNSGLAQNIGWIARPNIATIFQFIFDLIEPFYYEASNTDASSNFYITIPILLVIITATVFYLSGWRQKDETEKRDFILLLILIKLPLLLIVAASWILPHSIWGTRHLIIVFAPMAIFTAIVLGNIEIKPLKIGLISLIFLLSVAAFAIQLRMPQPKFIWCGWEDLARNIDAGKPQKIYVFEDLVAYHFWFALRESDQVQIVKIKDVAGIKEDTAYFLPRGFDKVQTTDENGITGERFWIAFRGKEFDLSKPPLRNLTDKGYKIGEPKIFEARGLKAFLVEVQKEN
jgi:uncharacterized membrane protein